MFAKKAKIFKRQNNGRQNNENYFVVHYFVFWVAPLAGFALGFLQKINSFFVAVPFSLPENKIGARA